MNSFRTAFAAQHVVLPVVHVAGESQAIANTEIAKKAGADGVFLINHSMPWQSLLEVYWTGRAHYNDWWIGVNCLGLPPENVFGELPDHLNGVWVDNARIDERAASQPKADLIASARRKSQWQGLYFGGVAFKYQRSVEDLASATRVSMSYMDVVTTSGPGTGEAAAVEKIRIMKNTLGDSPLAIASGVTPENVGGYLGCADCFLVATGISQSFHMLSLEKTRDLVARVRAWSGEDDGRSS